MSAPNDHYSFCGPAFLMANLGVKFSACKQKNTICLQQFSSAFRETRKAVEKLQTRFNKCNATAFCEDFGCAKIREIQQWFSMEIKAQYPSLDTAIQNLANELIALSTNIDRELTCNGQSKNEAKSGVAENFIETLRTKNFVDKKKKGEWNVYVPLCRPCPIRYDPLHPEKYKSDLDLGENVCRRILENIEKRSLKRSVYVTKNLKDLKVEV